MNRGTDIACRCINYGRYIGVSKWIGALTALADVSAMVDRYIDVS